MKQAILSILVGIMIGLVAFCAFQGGDAPSTGEIIGDTVEALVSKTPDEPEAASDGPSQEFSPIVIVDNDICSVVLTNIELDGLWDYSWEISLVNHTNKNLMFSMEHVTVNGLDSDPYWGTSVSAGAKENTTIDWYDDFSDYGIDAVTEVAFDLRVYDNDDWSEEDLFVQRLTVYPMGEDALGQMYQRQSADTDMVLLENDICSVILTGVEPQDQWGYSWYLYLENKTDRHLSFSMEDVCLNGLVCDPWWGTSVAAGAGKHAVVEWYDDLSAYGITEVTTAEFLLTVCNEDDWSNVYEDTLTVYPLGEAAAGAVYQRQPSSTDTVLMDNDLCSVILTEIDPDGDWGYTVTLFLINKSQQDLGFTVDDVTVNDYMCDPYWGTSIPAERSGFSEIYWYPSDFEENDITEVTEIVLPFTVYDDKEYDTLLTETVTISP